MSDRLSSLLSTRPWVLADGATGTNLFAMGLVSGDAPELWNVDHPERIAALHRGFIEAGADIVLTNSFGGSRYRLKLHHAEARVHELNSAAARIARAEADAAGRTVVVAGSMGPTGEILEPLGPLSAADAASAFAEQAAALAAGGADVLWIETMSSREEVEAAIQGARATGLPIVSTLSFDTNGRTMMSLMPSELAAIHRAHGLLACGSNCGVGPSELVASIVNLANASDPSAVLVAKSNCGLPQYVDGAIRYDGTPELMGAYACLAYDAGARIIGGCCGTTPAHLRAMRTALEGHVRGTRPDAAVIESTLGNLTNGARAQLRGDLDRASGAAAPGARRSTSRRGAGRANDA
ncbi:MAG: betaine--homocysteine S-methyltransferase [Proteobacteria bacterium]|nr:betaine--homocysteine S-methyltransferase [Pseudomonadota bacterium]